MMWRGEGCFRIERGRVEVDDDAAEDEWEEWQEEAGERGGVEVGERERELVE